MGDYDMPEGSDPVHIFTPPAPSIRASLEAWKTGHSIGGFHFSGLNEGHGVFILLQMYLESG